MGDIYHNIITSEINDLVRQQIRITEGQGWRLFSQFMAIISEGLGVLSDLFVQNSSKDRFVFTENIPIWLLLRISTCPYCIKMAFLVRVLNLRPYEIRFF